MFILNIKHFIVYGYTYRQIFAYNLAIDIIFLWAFFGAVALLFKALANLIETKTRKYTIQSQVELGESNHSNPEQQLHASLNDSQSDIERQPVQNRPFRISGPAEQWYKAFSTLYSIFSWGAWLLISLTPVTLSAFSELNVFIAIFLTFCILMFRTLMSLIRSFPLRDKKDSLQETLRNCYKLSPVRVISLIFVMASIAVFFNMATYKSCINAKVDSEYGIRFGKHRAFIYSSAFTRFFSVPKVCPPGKPCQVYATLPFDTATSVFINVHTHTKHKQITIKYDTKDNKAANGKLGIEANSTYTISPSEYDRTGERNIHTVLLKNLTANTPYIIEIFYDGETRYSTTYHTLPAPDSKSEFNLLYGGDIGISDASKAITDLVPDYDPKALVVGGDLAYDDGEPSCYYSLDLTLNLLREKIDEKLGRLVPFIIAAGNHDVGYESLADVPHNIRLSGPSYYTNFPQHYTHELTNSKAEAEVPEVFERKTYHAHMLGNLLNVVLDAGYVANYSGPQLTWLRNISTKYPTSPKIAIYHDPIYMPCPEFAAPRNEADGLKYWVPEFDRHNYMSVFEHHAHMYKRTLPIRGSQVHENGTIYMGNGDWGVNPEKCQGRNESLIYAGYSPTNHVWVVKVNQEKNTIHYEAIDKKGKKIEKEKVHQNMLNYTTATVSGESEAQGAHNAPVELEL